MFTFSDTELKFDFNTIKGKGIDALLPRGSRNCVSLIKAFLVYDPDKRYHTKITSSFHRITAEEALQHPFLTKSTPPKQKKSIQSKLFNSYLPRYETPVPNVHPNGTEKIPSIHNTIANSNNTTTIPNPNTITNTNRTHLSTINTLGHASNHIKDLPPLQQFSKHAYKYKSQHHHLFNGTYGHHNMNMNGNGNANINANTNATKKFDELPPIPSNLLVIDGMKGYKKGNRRQHANTNTNGNMQLDMPITNTQNTKKHHANIIGNSHSDNSMNNNNGNGNGLLLPVRFNLMSSVY
jgi:hypothetical protein